jgi:hypothetical protein
LGITVSYFAGRMVAKALRAVLVSSINVALIQVGKARDVNDASSWNVDSQLFDSFPADRNFGGLA